MITQDQMEEWVREAEERPASGALIVKFVVQRLKNLTERNEELLAENIQLRTNQRIDEYERRIASLEYQLELLRRQFGGEIPAGAMAGPAAETFSVLIYNPKGRVTRASVKLADLKTGAVIARFGAQDELLAGGPVRMIAAPDHEEMLFVIDTGRVNKIPVSQCAQGDPAALTWKRASSAEPHAGEELAAALAIGRMTLFDYCVQVSRRGSAKRMMRASFEGHVSKNFIGAGVKAPPDKTCCLVFCNKDERMVFVTREGSFLMAEVNQLSYTIEEVMKLYATDYLVTAFTPGKKRALLIVTNNGKAVNREMSWLELAASTKTKGQAILSPARREAGMRLAGAAPVDENDWCLVLNAAGEVSAHKAGDLLSAGSVPGDAEILDMVVMEGKGVA